MYMHNKLFLQFQGKRCKTSVHISCSYIVKASHVFLLLASGTSLFEHTDMCKSFYGLRALWYLGLWHPMLVQIIPFYVPI